jgi:hypothetical protein
MSKPTIFIGSSSKSADVADAVFRYLNEFANPRHWKDMFPPGETTIDSLLLQASKCDFAVLIMTADDELTSNGINYAAARDNVLFELGLFMGAIRPKRSFMLEEAGPSIATDLSGITRARFERSRGRDLNSAVRAACTDIRAAILGRGTANRTAPLPVKVFTPVSDEWFNDYKFDRKDGALGDWDAPRNLDLNRGLSLYWLAHDLLWTVCALITYQAPNQIRRGLVSIAWQLEQFGLMYDKFYNEIRQQLNQRKFTEEAWDQEARSELAADLFNWAHTVGDILNRHYRNIGCPGKMYYPLPPRPESPANMAELKPFGYELPTRRRARVRAPK